MNKLVLFLLALLSLGLNIAYGDCTFSGKTYPEGASIPGYICQGGVWVPKGQ